MNLIGEVAGRRALIVDDMIDTGGTFVATVDLLLRKGAREIIAAVTHPVFSGRAVQRIEVSPVRAVGVCDTLSTPQRHLFRKIHLVSTAKIFAQAILSIHNGRSLSKLFVQQSRG
jgi:ribose-phosphate pyrophosphokinase